MYKIPTPEQVDYYDDRLFDIIMKKVSTSISNHNFVIKPYYNWHKFEKKVHETIKESGWKLTTKWSGTKDDGYDTWVISPE